MALSPEEASIKLTEKTEQQIKLLEQRIDHYLMNHYDGTQPRIIVRLLKTVSQAGIEFSDELLPGTLQIVLKKFRGVGWNICYIEAKGKRLFVLSPYRMADCVLPDHLKETATLENDEEETIQELEKQREKDSEWARGEVKE